MGYFDQRVESMNGVIEKSSYLDELAKRMENFDKVQMEMNAMIVKNDELKTSMLTSLQKCNDKLDKNTELLHEDRNNSDRNNRNYYNNHQVYYKHKYNSNSTNNYRKPLAYRPTAYELHSSGIPSKPSSFDRLIRKSESALFFTRKLGEDTSTATPSPTMHHVLRHATTAGLRVRCQLGPARQGEGQDLPVRVQQQLRQHPEPVYLPVAKAALGYGPKGKDMSPVKTRDRSKSRDFKEFNLTDEGFNPNFIGSYDANSFSTSHYMEYNHLDTSRTHAEGVENIFRELKKVIQNTAVKQEIEKEKSRVDIRINSSIDADKESNDLAENLSVQNERLTKNRNSPKVLTKKIRKLVDVSNTRLTRYRQDLIDRTHNVEGNLVSFKYGKSGKRE